MSLIAAARPYGSLFASRFQLLLQYRGAAVAGFITQCWWGGIKVMVLAAFYTASAVSSQAPLSLSQVITYTWLGQASLALVPWIADPDIGNAVRTGAIGYDRLRPLDFYLLWYSRTAGWIAARSLPRALLIAAFAGVLLPLLGFEEWSWRLPSSVTAGVLFVISIGLALMLSAAMVMLLNVGVVASLNQSGINALAAGPVVVLSGNMLPLSLLPNEWHTVLQLQPFAGVLDIPARIYFEALNGADAFEGLAIQLFWVITLVALGRWFAGRCLRHLEVQGG